MKTKIVVTELSHEDLVDILSTALYDCEYLSAAYDRKSWNSILDDKKEGTCFEDRLADMLLNGLNIEITDYYAEGEVYTKHKSIESTEVDEDGNVTYLLNLEDFLWACSSEKGYKLVKEIISGYGDYYTANNLLQIVMFGEIIYG